MIIAKKSAATKVGAVVLSLGVGLGLGAVLQPSESLTQDAPANLGVIAAARGRVDVDGGLSRILAMRDGVVREVQVVESQWVRKGDVLGSLDTRQPEMAIRAAEAELGQAKGQLVGLRARTAAQARQVDRLKRAAKGQAVSAQILDEGEASLATLSAETAVAESAVVAAQSRLDSARYELELRIFRAPMDGRVARRSIKPGDVVSAQAMTEVFTLIPNTPRIVRAEIQEQFVNLVKPGLEAEIASELDDRVSVVGKVTRVGETLDTRRSSDSPGERADVRVADCIIAFAQDAPFLIGQRVYVRFKRAAGHP
ncbi:HlyD family efflux transporter periplasmic adaptor subunit [Boseaceae bacterium BT-24-1]|nr:HlyD family efflux transporter periplasmic adaptor subunit [Boseaceae bacterium BT-24-1]